MSINGPEPRWSVQPFPGLQINSTAISANGATMITGTSIEGASSDDFAVYCYVTGDGSSGQLAWSDPLGQTAYDGIFWVAISADGAYAAAGGSYGKSGPGFLRLYNVAEGASSRQEFATTGRVNEVEMSADGTTVVAVFEDTVSLYTRSGGTYQLTGTATLPGAYVRTCAISPDGTWVAVGGNQDDATPTRTRRPSSPRRTTSSGTGFVTVFINQQGVIDAASTWKPTAGVLRVVMTGAFVANANEDGSVQLYSRVFMNVYTLAWTFWPTPQVSYIYALAIGQTADGTVYVAAGGNDPSTSPSAGTLFMIRSAANAGGTGFDATQLWSQALPYAPNPATNMDAAVTTVTAAVGEPHSGTETPGDFYLFDAMTGTSPWGGPYATSIMNWAMVINTAGTAVFGGSDNGYIYYWGNPTT